MTYSEDHIALAAEYALGTLDADERAQVEIMMAVDTEFTAIVDAWAYRLGVLNQMVGSVEPRPIVWENIKAAVGHSGGQAPMELPEAPPVTPVVVEEAPGVEQTLDQTPDQTAGVEQISVAEQVRVMDNSNVIRLTGRLRRWRSVASVATAIAAALSPCSRCRSISRICCPIGFAPQPRTQVVEVKTPVQPTPPSAQYVALLQQNGGSPAFILTVDAATKNFTVRKVGADAEPGKSFELWLISDKLPQPRSLGVIGGSEFTVRPVLSSYDAGTINAATYAVTVEQAGGSPDGTPHSTPIYTGKLIETVPASAPR